MTLYRKINIWNQTSILVFCMFWKFGMKSILVIRSLHVKETSWKHFMVCTDNVLFVKTKIWLFVCKLVILLFIYISVDQLVILCKFLVRSETYVFSESLVHKDYKKICLHLFTVPFLWKWFVSYDVIIVTIMKNIIRKII